MSCFSSQEKREVEKLDRIFQIATEITGGLENMMHEERLKKFCLLNSHSRILGDLITVFQDSFLLFHFSESVDIPLKYGGIEICKHQFMLSLNSFMLSSQLLKVILIVQFSNLQLWYVDGRFTVMKTPLKFNLCFNFSVNFNKGLLVDILDLKSPTILVYNEFRDT